MDRQDRIIALHDESEKRIGVSGFLYLSVLFATFAFSFSKALPSEKYVEVPLLSLKMDKWNSIEVMCLLAGVLAFRIIILEFFLARLKLHVQNYDQVVFSFPTLVSVLSAVLERIGLVKRNSFVSVLTLYLPVLILLFYSGLARLKWRLSVGLGPFGVSWWIIFIVIFFLFASSLLLQKHLEKHESILELPSGLNSEVSKDQST